MGKSQLSLEETRKMFIYVCKKMEESKDLLTQADKAIGDGDHGTAISHAMDAVEKAIQDTEGTDLKSLFTAIGWGVMSVHGGATGPLFGSLFMGLSDGVGNKDQLDCATLAEMFESGLANDIFENPQHPYTKGLLNAIPKIYEKTERLGTIPGMLPGIKNYIEGCKFSKRCDRELSHCAQTRPELIPIKEDHLVACWLYNKSK